MTAEKEVYIYPCQANTAMTIAVGDSCVLVSNAQAREMADRIYEVLNAYGRDVQSPEPKITIDWVETEKNIEREFSSLYAPDGHSLTLANTVACIIKQGFDFDEAMAIVKMAKGGE